MQSKINRIYVQKKPGFNVEAKNLLEDLKENLNVNGLEEVLILNRYDVLGISDEVLQEAKHTIFSSPQTSLCMEEEYAFDGKDKIFAVEFLPGQFDQRSNSLAECLQVFTNGVKPVCKSAKIYILKGNVTDEEVAKIKRYMINPVETRECSLEKPETLEEETEEVEDVQNVEGFITANLDDKDILKKVQDEYGFGMDAEDLKHCQKYFRDVEKRDPTLTEMKMLDTYWSDHCRHTTFLTKLEKVDIKWDLLQEIYDEYLKSRELVYADKEAKDICLMDIATIVVKELRKRGTLGPLDESEEVNACCIKAEILVDGKPEEYLVMFKNETHNHPTEIEPFGGAATCLGGGIRDPLSGRSYVYQAMRITGCADPTMAVEKTMAKKLPQKTLTQQATKGYSSYGNEAGLAAGQVVEIYHPNYVAKRLELGALVSAAPRENVVREKPMPGDKVILLGGRTGRDGVGGATGSSKSHDSTSIEKCSAEVQKGNASEGRRLQRLFRNSEASKLIKRCNDFGAGGVSVAIGELADGLEIDLDTVPTKYPGMNGTEIAISESQERMAVVVADKDVERFQELASKENLETTVVATVSEEPRVRMKWRGKTIVDLSREFIDTNGTTKSAEIKVSEPKEIKEYFEGKDTGNAKEQFKNLVTSLNCCSQRGMVETFDSTAGAGTVMMPFGGKYQLTPNSAMCARIPTLKGYTNSGTIMAYGYDPYLAVVSPFHGAVFSNIEAISKYVAMGGDYKNAWLTLQEYFERLGTNPEKWAKPFGALLGSYYIQRELGIPAVGGKDSMSGTYNDIDVPPALLSFCVGVVDINKVVSNEFKKAGSKVVLLQTKLTKDYMPDLNDLKENYEIIYKAINEGKVLSCSSVRQHGIADEVFKSAIGNKIGFKFTNNISVFNPMFGSFIVEVKDGNEIQKAVELGETVQEAKITLVDGEVLDLEELIKMWEKPLEKIFPTRVNTKLTSTPPNIKSDKTCNIVAKNKFAAPRIFIPVFPGTNCEYELAKAFENAGGIVNIVPFKNLAGKDIEESIVAYEEAIKESQIIMLPGGLSLGGEPDGVGKLITSVFRNARLKEAIHGHLNEKDGLMLGIGEGFKVLMSLGLVPYGQVMDLNESMPTLAINTIGKYQSKFITTKVTSKLSPWFNRVNLGDEFLVPISYGEGRFVASEDVLEELIANGQIATQYVDPTGNATYDIQYNPSGSTYAIEGITNKDGRILGRMAHSERTCNGVVKNVLGNGADKIFESGVGYFK